jgi:hypothetical protein
MSRLVFPIKDIDGNIIDHERIVSFYSAADGVNVVTEKQVIHISDTAYEYLIEYNRSLSND